MILLLQLLQQTLAGVDVAMGAEHPRHRAIRVARNDMAAVFNPQVAAIRTFAAVLHSILFSALGDVGLKMLHHPRVVVGMDDALPGEHRVVQ
ncbi:hypothetical protein D3C79_785920 [compost metagenome]